MDIPIDNKFVFENNTPEQDIEIPLVKDFQDRKVVKQSVFKIIDKGNEYKINETLTFEDNTTISRCYFIKKE